MNEQRIKDIFREKSATEVIAILTVLTTVVAFFIRGFWYFYEWGYYKAIGVSRIYIEVEGIANLYYALAYLGVASLFIVSNYFSYSCWINKKWLAILMIILIETGVFFLIVFVSGNVSIQEAYSEIVYGGLAKEYTSLLMKVFLLMSIFNFYGIYFGWMENRERKDRRRTEERKEHEIKLPLKYSALGAVLFIILEGGFAFLTGMSSGYDKKDYKIIVENNNPDVEEKIEDRYIFSIGNDNVMIFPILYENRENYIVSYLCWNDKENYIESKHQKVISKECIETLYCENIFAIGDIRTEKANDYKDEKEQVGGYKMMETLIGALIGAALGGLCTYIIEERKRTKENKRKENHAAAMLFYDLKSIERYITTEQKDVNLRYSIDWQNMVTECPFLDDDKIELLYQIYDEIYNFNYSYLKREEKGKKVFREKIPQYKSLYRKMFDTATATGSEMKYIEKYNELLKQLRIHINS